MSVGSVSGTADTTAVTASTKLGKEDFLKLLVTQMQYQNPLDPMDPAQMLSQISQLSQVEQLTNISETLTSLSSSMTTGNQVEWLSLAGKKACVGSSTLSKGDQAVLTPGGDYDRIILTLKNSEGSTREITFNPGDSLVYSYDGDETVSASVTGIKKGGTVSCGLKVYSTISGVELGESGATLVLANGGRYGTESIKGVRD